MDPHQSNNKRSCFSKFLSEEWNKIFPRPSPPLPSENSSHAPSLLSLPPTPLLAFTGSALPLENVGDIEPQASLAIRAPILAPGVGCSAPAGSRSEAPAILVSSVATDSSGVNEGLARPTTSTDPTHVHPERSKVWARLVTGIQALHINKRLPPPLQSAISTFIPCLDVLEEVARSRHEYEELASELACIIDLLVRHGEQSTSTQMSGSIANIVHSIEEQAKLIGKRRSRGTGRRLMEANVDMEELERHYRRIRSLFQQLQADANLSIWNIVNDQMANTRLKDLSPAQLACYNSNLSTGISRRTCTANTRTDILSELNDWSHDSNAADVYWMNGMAGTGKTTIACSLSQSLEERKQLAASFFCTRTVPECREATRIIPTIAYQLARYSASFRSALCETLGEDPDVSAKNLMMQFERLLKTPLLKVKEAIPRDLVVVIDALDECTDMREVELLLSIILKSVKELPLKFFVTSRPEPEIYKRMLAQGQGAGSVLHLHEVEKSLVQADIEIYLAVELDFMSPTPTQIKELARRSGNLFIYAATLVRYIRPSIRSANPHTRLQSVLAITSQPSKLHAEMDELYTAILASALNAEGLEDEEIQDLQLVLWTAVCVQEPVSVDTMVAMTGINNANRIMSALDALRSVIHFSESSGLVSTLHASFPDFMFDKTRSRDFACNLVEHSERITRKCFEVMHEQLCFNICNLESSFIPDSEVSNLEERVKQYISAPLWYACRYWSVHLLRSIYSDSLCAMLSDFLSVRLLFWMEVLNLKREIRIGVKMFLQAKRWLKIGVAPPDLARLIEDARNFVTSFFANPVSESTPHIYLSSLPFCPRTSSVYKQYRKRTQGIINITGSAMQIEEPAAQSSWKIQSGVCSVVYSPNGSRVAVGCEDGTVSVRGAHDGALITGPFQGHSDWVWSVVYSPDGARIASGSMDKTIRIWNAHDGTLIAGPLRGHTDSVYSVAYSPDGSSIVSGSADQTIRFWSAHDGTLLAGPLEGHTNRVFSVAYSPDGSRIVSGSTDSSIRVWSVRDGALLTGPLLGHTGSVYSVSYSPDGSYIASGSADYTVRVWSAHSGALFAGPFQGHTGPVYSVSFSPSNTHIVSGSVDGTVRIWNVNNSTPLVSLFQGHANSVYSTAYSPDSSRIISGSTDETIRVWSTYDGGPGQGHIDWVQSAACSLDGLRVAPSSRDSTSQFSDAYDTRFVVSPPHERTDSASSAPDSPLITCAGSASHRIAVSRAPKPPTLYHISMSNSSTGDWTVRNDGWVLDNSSQLLFWMPFELACYRPTRNRLSAVYPHDLSQIDHDDIFIGEFWHLCYKPN